MKKLLWLIPILLIFGCQKEEDDQQNIQIISNHIVSFNFSFPNDAPDPLFILNEDTLYYLQTSYIVKTGDIVKLKVRSGSPNYGTMWNGSAWVPDYSFVTYDPISYELRIDNVVVKDQNCQCIELEYQYIVQ